MPPEVLADRSQCLETDRCTFDVIETRDETSYPKASDLTENGQ
jgi:hypothetical protein